MKTIDRPGSFNPEGTGEAPRPQKDRIRPTKAQAALAALLAAGTAYAGVRAMSNSESTLMPQKDKVEHTIEMNEDKRSENERLYDFVNKYKDIALEAATKNSDMQLPYELLLAVAIHESNYGQSELAVNANNFFGVIAKDGWKGDIYAKLTTEEIDGKDIKMTRPFRKYDSPAESFEDFVNKIYFKNQDGSYRYTDVVEYIQQGGNDPITIVNLLSDKNEPGEVAYATDSDWRKGVTGAITQIQSVSELSEERTANEPTRPEISSGKIDIEQIDFSSLDPEQHSRIIEAQKEGFSRVSIEGFNKYQSEGITKIGQKGLEDIIGSDPGIEEYIRSHYKKDIPKDQIQYFIIHLWGNGLIDIGDTEGSSHNINLSTQIKSWYNRRLHGNPSCGYLLSDNEPADLWQLTDGQFGRSNHAGNGIQDSGKRSHANVGNNNSVGIEVQADTIYDVSAQQYETLVYWATKMLIDAGKIQPGMSESVVHTIVDKMVIGHGKNAGLEFGYKYTRSMIDAIAQFAYEAVNQED